jgi:DNA-binding NtrC family response regulator
VSEYLLDDHWVLDAGNDFDDAAAFGTAFEPFDPEELFHHLERIKGIKALSAENEALKASLAELKVAPDLIGKSEVMHLLIDKVKMVADSEHTVLIQGASGTGKEKIANAIQSFSQRKDKPFVKINCSALSESLFETEMFGHEKGAFTGAIKQSIGRFERAKGGSIFLDDIDDLSLRLQTKLLRVIQEGEIERVGGTQVINVDVRLIAATKVDLKSLVSSGSFREDLYYRLNVIKLRVPNLNERQTDIPLLSNYFLNQASPGKQLSPELLAYLTDQNWPGNVRELEHLILQMSVFSKHETIGLSDLPEAYRSQERPGNVDDRKSTLFDRVSAFEANVIAETMQKHGDNQKKVANALGMPRTTLRSKLMKYGILDPASD